MRGRQGQGHGQGWQRFDDGGQEAHLEMYHGKQRRSGHGPQQQAEKQRGPGGGQHGPGPHGEQQLLLFVLTSRDDVGSEESTTLLLYDFPRRDVHGFGRHKADSGNLKYDL